MLCREYIWCLHSPRDKEMGNGMEKPAGDVGLYFYTPRALATLSNLRHPSLPPFFYCSAPDVRCWQHRGWRC